MAYSHSKLQNMKSCGKILKTKAKDGKSFKLI